MSATTLFDTRYEKQKEDLLQQVLERMRPVFTADELGALRIDPVNPAILSQRSGRGFVDRDILETVLGNLLGQVSGIYPPEVAVAQLNLEGVSGPG